MEDKQCEVRIIIEDENKLYNAADIGKLLKISNIHTSIKNINDKVIRKTNSGNQSMTYLTQNAVKLLISKSRSIYASEVSQLFGMNCTNIYSPTYESSTIMNILTVFKDENTKHQYTIDNYRIDLYFIDYKLAIECDENHHKNNIEKDKQRQTYIEKKLDCQFIRYNPENKDFDIFKVISLIFNHIKIYAINKTSIDINNLKII
jgi:very-short-patch-repair endonuclease